MVSSKPESESLSAAAILAELEPLPLQDKDFDVLLEDLPEDLPDDLLEAELDEVFKAFSSCSCLSVRHLEMLCPLHLQWVHFFLLSCFFFALPKLLAKYAIASPPAACMQQFS